MEANQQNQIADSFQKELTRLLKDSGHSTLENWCIACITEIPNDLYHAMYFSEELRKVNLRIDHLLKDQSVRIPSEMEIAKISFMDRLYGEMNKLLDDPTDLVEVLKMQIEITKEDIAHEFLRKTTQKVNKLQKKLKNLELMLQIQGIISDSKIKLKNILEYESVNYQLSSLELIELEIQTMKAQYSVEYDDDISDDTISALIKFLEGEMLSFKNNKAKLQKVTVQLNKVTAILNKIKERDILGHKKSQEVEQIETEIQILENTIPLLMQSQNLENIQAAEELLKMNLDDEVKLAGKKNKLEECKKNIQQLRHIIDGNDKVQFLKRKLHQMRMNFLEIDSNDIVIASAQLQNFKSAEQLMKNHQNLPDCLENSLNKLIYFTEAAIANAEDSIFKQENIKFAIKEIISRIETQYNEEGYPKDKNRQSVLMIKEKGNQIEEHLDLQGILELAKSIIPSLKKFDFQEFFHLYSKVDKSAQEIKGKDIILLLGATGSGKSTTIHYLCGSLLKVVKAANNIDHIQAAKIINKHLLDVRISAEFKSETRYITPIEINLRDLGAENDGKVILVDSPGAEDTESYEVDIANMLGIIKAINQARSVRPIILISYGKQGCRNEDMKGMLQFYCTMIQNVSANLKNFQFVFNKANGEKDLTGVHADLINIQNNLDTQDRDREFESLMKQLIEKTYNAIHKKGPQQVRIMRPLDIDFLRFHEDIQETDGITNPGDVFVKTVLPVAYDQVDQQFTLSIKTILDALSNNKIELAFYKFNELIDFASIFPESETYELFIKNLLQDIKSFFDKTFKNGMENIENVFTKGNKLSQSILDHHHDCYNQAKELDQFVNRCRKLVEELRIKNPILQDIIVKDWKTSDLFRYELRNLSSFENFPKDLDIESPRWSEYFSRLELIILSFQKRDQQQIGEETIEFLGEQISQGEKAFKQKMSTIRDETISIIEKEIGIEQEKNKFNIDLAKQTVAKTFEKIQSAELLSKDDAMLSKIILEARLVIEEALINKFEYLKISYFKDLISTIEQVKKQEEQNKRIQINQEETVDLQIINVKDDQAASVTQFLEVHQQIVEDLKFFSNEGYLKKLNSIASVFQADLFNIYTINEMKLRQVVTYPKSKVPNIKNANRQIALLRKIPFIKERTNISYSQIISKINQLFIHQKQIIDEILPELAQKMNEKKYIVIFTLYKLKDAVKIIIDLKEICEECALFYLDIEKDLHQNLEGHLELIQEDIQYCLCDFQNIGEIKKVEQLTKQILQLKEFAQLIGYEIKFKNDQIKIKQGELLDKIKTLISKNQQKEEQKQSVEQQQQIQQQQQTKVTRQFKRNNFDQLQKMFLYLQGLQEAPNFLHTLDLEHRVTSLRAEIIEFVNQHFRDVTADLKTIIGNIDAISRIIDFKMKTCQRFLDKADLEADQNVEGERIIELMQSKIQNYVEQIQEILRTSKHIMNLKYFNIKDFSDQKELEDLTKSLVEDLIIRIGNLKNSPQQLDVNMIILRKLIILDILLFQDLKTISKQYDEFEKKFDDRPTNEHDKVLLDIEAQNYDTVRDTLSNLSKFVRNNETVKKIQNGIREKERYSLQQIKKLSQQFMTNEVYDSYEIHNHIGNILLIHKYIEQSYLSSPNDKVLNLIQTFYQNVYEKAVEAEKQLKYMSETIDLESYYRIRQNQKIIFTKISLKKESILTFAPEKIESVEYVILGEILGKIKEQEKQFEKFFQQDQDPIKILIEKTRESKFQQEQFPKIKPLIEKLEKFQDMEGLNNEKELAKQAIVLIYDSIKTFFDDDLLDLNEKMQSNTLKESDLKAKIDQNKMYFEYIPDKMKSEREIIQHDIYIRQNILLKNIKKGKLNQHYNIKLK